MISEVPSFNNIKKYVELALKKFGKNDIKLLEYSIDEYAYSHHIANYLNENFSTFGYDVDCDYNKEGKAGEVKKGNEDLQNLEINNRRKQKKGLRPDIIIHERGVNDNNLLIIEIKKLQAKNRDKENDREKLKKFTKSPLKYKYGLFLTISKVHPYPVEGEFFEDGIPSTDKKIDKFNLSC